MGQPSSCCAAKHGSKPQNFILKSSGNPKLPKMPKMSNISFWWNDAAINSGLNIVEKTFRFCEDLEQQNIYDTVRTLDIGWAT